jgi:hypothetical protein
MKLLQATSSLKLGDTLLRLFLFENLSILKDLTLAKPDLILSEIKNP